MSSPKLHRMLHLLCAMHTQPRSAEALGQALGISVPTIKQRINLVKIMNSTQSTSVVERFTVHWIDSTGPVYKTFDSLEEVRRWSNYTGKVLGTADRYMPTYEVSKSSGGSLTPEQLQIIQPQSSEETFLMREIEALKFINGGVLPNGPVATMYSGAAMATVFKSGALSKSK